MNSLIANGNFLMTKWRGLGSKLQCMAYERSALTTRPSRLTRLCPEFCCPDRKKHKYERGKANPVDVNVPFSTLVVIVNQSALYSCSISF